VTVLREAYVNVLPKTDNFDPELKKRLRRIDTAKEGRQVATRFGVGFSGAFGSIASRSAAVFAAGFAAVSGVKVFGKFIADAQESERVSKLTASTIKATGGAAKVTADQVGRLAGAISLKTGKDDEAIQSGQNMLLTFRNVADRAGKNNKIFTDASSVLTDMVAAMNGGEVTQESMSKGAVSLGKALNDPIKGVGALSRVGVTFTDQQKKQIKAMVKAGDIAGAQKIILGELKSEFGGAAEASSNAGDKMKVALGNVSETIGTALLPTFNRFAGFVAKTVVPGVQAMFAAFQEGDITSDGFVGKMELIGVKARLAFDYFKAEVVPRLKEFAVWIRDNVVPVLVSFAQKIGSLVKWFNEHRVAAYALLGVLGSLVTIYKVTTTVQAIQKAGLISYLGLTKAVKVATVTWTGVQWLLNAALSANPLGLVTIAVAALVAGIVVAWKRSETFRDIVKGVWSGIRTAIGAVVGWFTGTVVPSFKRAIGQAVGAFNGFKSALNTAWGFIRDKVFNPIKTFILTTIPNAFKAGVAAIGRFWDGLKAAAAKPVRFVIDTVINKGVIGGINWVAGKVGVKGIPQVPMPKGLGDGPGLPALPRGAGDGIGDLFKGGMSLFSNPAKWLADRLPLGDIKRRFGDNPLTSVLVGAGKKTLGFGVEKLKSLLSFLDVGSAGKGIGGAAAGLAGLAGLQPGILGVLGDLRSVFGNVPVISGFRRNAHTLSGNLSYHALGRAIDISPVLGWAQYLRYFWGPRLRELITPWNELNILNGRPHRYTGAVWNQHNFAGGNAHIHAAMANGGVIREPVFGVGRSGRTYSFGERGPETVTPGVGGDVHVTVLLDGQAIEPRMVKVITERDRGLRRRVQAGATR
jgi:hypothetical protein